ncbi:MAG: glucokinase [Thiohalophilus sp.]
MVSRQERRESLAGVIMRVIAGDLGGTRCRLALAHVSESSVSFDMMQEYPAAEFPDFDSVLARFIEQLPKNVTIVRSCFAVAGPVQGGQANLTNLPWQLDSQKLQDRFSIGSVSLINDFAANGYCLDVLDNSELLPIQPGENRQGNRVILGAGTGLGMALVYGHAGTLQVKASEGGHMDFAPLDEEQDELLRFLRRDLERVSYEHVLSGPGLVRLYRYLAWKVAENIESVLQQRDVPAAISRLANEEGEPLACRALDLFLRIYGSCAANLALVGLASGGVYLAGGVTGRLAERLTNGEFIRAFLNKPPMQHLLQAMPVKVITHAQAGLLGAAWYAGNR